ncbi:MAG: HvfC/BufC family peptide modification chaperone [Gemmatimonadota bacterium]
MALADLQRAVRSFVVLGDNGESLARALVGGEQPLRRLEIHRRHYRASLIEAIRTKFPATAWLVGERTLGEAAGRYIATAPPTAPCISEYGVSFPTFLANEIGDQVPYVAEFAALEWDVGQVSVSVDASPLDPIPSGAAAGGRGSRYHLQPGIRFVQGSWPVDRLFGFFLTDTAPESFVIVPEAVYLEVRGSRGDFRISRVSVGRLAFRDALAGGGTLDDASARALAAEPTIDVEREVVALHAEGLVVSIQKSGEIEP